MSKNLKPCARCNHAELHGTIAGCVANTADLGQPARWCDCPEYVAPASEKVGRVIPSRNTDPGTSHAAAKAIVLKAGNQRTRLLAAFATRLDATDEEAMEAAEDVSPLSEFAKRCSELRDAGLIEPTGATRSGQSGVQRIVSRLTQAGRHALQGLE